MEQFFSDYLDRLQSLHDDMKRTFEGLPKAALDWVPGPGMNSLCVVVVHVAGAERYWIGDVLAQDPSGRVRETEFHLKGLDVVMLEERLDGSLVYVRGVLEELTLDKLGAQRVSVQDSRTYTAGWSLAHVLEHTALHLGHTQLTRQLWEQQQGS